MPFSFFKLLEKSLLPIILVVFAKLVVVFFLCWQLGMGWNLGTSGSVFSLVIGDSLVTSQRLVLSTFSDLAASIAVATGFSWTLFRLNHFNQDTLHPRDSAKIHQNKQSFLLASASEILETALVWMSLSWIIFFLVLANFGRGYTTEFVVGFAGIASLALSYALFFNVRALKR